MGDMMTFPASVEEFMEQYKMTDTEHVYSNGTEYVPIYRMKQWFEHCRDQQRLTIDAVEVVRCRECKHWKPSGSKAGNSFSDMEYIGGCEFTNYYRSESDFCSYRERKEGADNEP